MILTHGANSVGFIHQNEVEIGGRRYPVVKIGNQLWMAENLDFKLSGITIGGSTDDISQPHAWYYNNDEATYGFNGNKDGLLYNGYCVATISAYLTSLGIGWAIPTIEDLQTLSIAGLQELKSTEVWQYPGTNESGFDSKPCGVVLTGDNPAFQGITTYHQLYSSSVQDSSKLKSWYITNSGQTMGTGYVTMKNAVSIRLVKHVT